VITIIVAALLLYGIFTERKCLVLPHLIWQVIGIVLLTIYAAVTLIMLSAGGPSFLFGNDVRLATTIMLVSVFNYIRVIMIIHRRLLPTMTMLDRLPIFCSSYSSFWSAPQFNSGSCTSSTACTATWRTRKMPGWPSTSSRLRATSRFTILDTIPVLPLMATLRDKATSNFMGNPKRL